jgi:bacteriocin biosynthesis cyclodehydratase domain-containing protein
VLATVNLDQRSAALALVDRLYAERVLVDGAAEDAHQPRGGVNVTGAGAGAALLQSAPSGPVPVLCQDRLDFAAALAFGRARRQSGDAWLWVSTGALARGFVSPIFLPDAGPCLGCLLNGFAQRSPLPELYDELRHDTAATLAAVPFPAAAARMLAALAEWKVGQLGSPLPAAATYRLHVLETASLEVTTHRVFADPHCAECGAEAR